MEPMQEVREALAALYKMRDAALEKLQRVDPRIEALENTLRTLESERTAAGGSELERADALLRRYARTVVEVAADAAPPRSAPDPRLVKLRAARTPEEREAVLREALQDDGPPAQSPESGPVPAVGSSVAEDDEALLDLVPVEQQRIAQKRARSTADLFRGQSVKPKDTNDAGAKTTWGGT